MSKNKLKQLFDNEAALQDGVAKKETVVTKETCNIYHAVERAQDAYFKKRDELNSKNEKEISEEDKVELERLKKKYNNLFEKFRSNMGLSSH